MDTGCYRKLEHDGRHMPTTITTKAIPSCKCCWMNEHGQRIERRASDNTIPKLIPGYKMYPRSHDIDDSVRVPVIQRAQYMDNLPLRKCSISSLEKDASHGYYSDKLYEEMVDRRSVSPTIYPYEYTNFDSKDFYKTLQQKRTHSERSAFRREKLTVLQNEDLHKEASEGYGSYRDIPSPNYSTSPIFINDLSPTETRFIYPPYMHSPLRTKYCSDYADLPHGIKKRHRTIFTPSQLRKLEEKFNECNFIVGEDRQLLAKQLKLKEHQVKIWFQNRRTKVKQSNKEGASEIDVTG